MTLAELTRRNDVAWKISLHTRFDNGATVEFAAEREGISLAEAESEYDAWLALVFEASPAYRFHPGVDDADF